MSLFTETLNGWQSWADVFRKTSAFVALTEAIYQKEGLGKPANLANLTPGTNAVFRCGGLVVKIFAPEETGFHSARDFAVETAMLGYAKSVGVATSDLVACGEIADRYRFRYILTKYVEGIEAFDVVKTFSKERRKDFMAQLTDILNKLNRPMPDLLPPVDLKNRAMQNDRLGNLPAPFAEAMRARAVALRWDDEVVVHGDLTGDNVILAPDGSPVLIDFADACHGPPFYELAALAFGLLRGDGALIRAFAGDADPKRFVETLLDSLALHDFGPNIILGFAKSESVDIGSLSLGGFSELLLQKWWGVSGSSDL